MARVTRAGTWRVVATVSVAALLLAACGDSDDEGGEASGDHDLQAGLRRAPHRAQRQPRHQHPQRRRGRHRGGQRGRRRHQVRARRPSTPRATPTRRPRPRTGSSTTQSIRGVVGPTFSGETRAVLPVPAGGGPGHGERVGHRHRPHRRPSPARRCSTASSPTTTSRARASPTTSPRSSPSSRAAYVHDNADYGKALADGTRGLLEKAGVSTVLNETIDPKSQDFSAVVNQVRAITPPPDMIFYGGYYSEAGRLKKQLTDGQVNVRFVSGDGSLDVGFVAVRRRARGRGRPGHLRLQAGHRGRPRQAGRVRQGLPGQVEHAARPPTPPRATTPPTSSSAGIKDGQHHPGRRCSNYVETLGTYEGAGKTIEFEANGNIKAGDVFVYEFQGGQADGARHHQSDRLTRPEPGLARDSRTVGPAIDTCFSCLRDQFWPQTVDGLTLGSIYALIALGYTLVYGVLRLINFAHSEVFMIGVFASLFAMHGLGIETGDPAKTGVALVVTVVVVMLVAMTVSGLTAVAMERIAYRPLRRRNAPRLAALITAIGVSLFLQELFAVRYGREILGLPPGPGEAAAGVDRRGRHPHRQGAGGRGGGDPDGRPGAVRGQVPPGPGHPGHRPGPGDGGHDGRRHQPGRRADVPAGRPPGRRRRDPVRRSSSRRPATTSGSCPGIKAFTAAVLGGIGNIRGALLGGLLLGLLENWGSDRPGRASGRTCSPSPCWCWCCCSGPPACWARAWGGPGRDRAGRLRRRRLGRGAGSRRWSAPVARWWDRQGRPVRAAVIALARCWGRCWRPLGLSTAWQSVLFYPVAVFVLLALGLNVVVGQAGLLDLGYVAFYAVGAYTTAKLTTARGLVGVGGADRSPCCWRRWRAWSWARPPCGCGATTWPSSRSASARSPASWPRTPSRWGRPGASPASPTRRR